MTNRGMVIVLATIFTGCGGGGSGSGGSSSPGNVPGSDLASSSQTDPGSGNGTSGGPSGSSSSGGPVAVPTDLCAGLVTDKAAHPMTALAKPALGATVTDAEFNTTIRRITAIPQSGSNPVIKPLYTTVSAWNADESKMVLYNVAAGRHELYDGKTYAFVRALTELKPADIEQVYWSTTDPDILYLVEGKNFVAYHVGAAQKQTLTTFSFCGTGATGGDDPMFTSFDSKRIGLKCGGTLFVYDIAANQVLGQKAIAENPAQMAPSGTLGYLSDSGRVVDTSLNVLRTLDLANPSEHASLGRNAAGQDYWAGMVYDAGKNNNDVGSLVVFDLATGNSKTVIGPKTGFPYPNDGHVSSLAYKNPGWAVASTYGKTNGAGLLDEEVLLANTDTGAVCRVGRHRSWGKANTHLGDSYWGEAHATPSPTGTRIVFASDWGDGTTVDTYVIELPSYH